MKRADIDLLLPEIFRRTLPRDPNADSPLGSLLDVMALLHEPPEDILAALPAYFDPYRAPDRFVPYLAGWVDLDAVWIDEAGRYTAATVPEFPAGTGRLRELIASVAELSRWRGTRRGLLLFLETATGVSGFEVEEDVTGDDGLPIPFHISVMIPAEAARYVTMIRRIIDIEKPAYVTYELALPE